jgi:hypothetical protein
MKPVILAVFFWMVFVVISLTDGGTQVPSLPVVTARIDAAVVSNSAYVLDGPPTISRQTYQNIFCEAESPACPETSEMYDELLAVGLDPVFEAAWARKETSFGLAGVGRPPSRNLHGVSANGWDGAVGSDGPFSMYASYQDSVRAWAHLMTNCGELGAAQYICRGLRTPDDILPIYAPPSENDTPMYISRIKQWVDAYRSRETSLRQ